MVEKLLLDAISGSVVTMEANFSQLTLDVIGIALFNYNFDSLITESPVIDAVYTALNETELHSTDMFPYWQAENIVSIIRQTIEELIAKFKEFVESEGERINEDEYVNDRNTKILRFFLAIYEEDPSALEKAHEEVDTVLGGCSQTYEDMKNLKFITWCIIESL